MNILLAANDPERCAGVCSILTDTHQIKVVEDGEVALTLLAKQPDFELVILDLHVMSSQDPRTLTGVQVLREMRCCGVDVSTIMVSADGLHGWEVTVELSAYWIDARCLHTDLRAQVVHIYQALYST